MTLHNAAPMLTGIHWAGQRMALETQWLNVPAADAERPLLVFLHEGLGSLAMWKDFPQQVCAAARCRGLVVSRPGYGQSTPLPENSRWASDFLDRQALEVLPAVFSALGVDPELHPVVLIGHSDGASIALIYAAASGHHVAGVVAVAPHCFVEDLTVRRIAALQSPAIAGGLLARLERYHHAPKPVFEAWSNIWLDRDFRAWSIIDRMQHIRCPVLAVQGLDDEYGSMEQIRSIGRSLPKARLLELASCGHSPHRDQPQALVAAICDFLNQNEGELQ